MKPTLLYQGSVKNLFSLGEDVLFEYSNRYSLFDWGEMPDHLEKKGESLALMGALFFKALSAQGICHHFLHLTNKNGDDVGWEPTPYMKVKKIPVFRPLKLASGYDYAFYKTRPQEGLVPLEVMFRYGAGKGSSLIKRVQDSPLLLKQWGLKSVEEGDLFAEPLIDFSTKLEKGDRYLTHKEAQELACLSDQEISTLVQETKKVAILLKDIFSKMNLELWDGKIEWAFRPGKERSFMLVDSIGLDELRLERNGLSLSKESLREFYRSTAWFEALKKSKLESEKSGVDFKSLCRTEPPHLPSKEKVKAESLYISFTNDLSELILQKRLFPETYTLANWPEGV